MIEMGLGTSEIAKRLGRHREHDPPPVRAQPVPGADRGLEFLLPLYDDLEVGLTAKLRCKPRIHALGDVERFRVLGEAYDFDRRNDRRSVRQRDDKLVTGKAN